MNLAGKKFHIMNDAATEFELLLGIIETYKRN